MSSWAILGTLAAALLAALGLTLFLLTTALGSVRVSRAAWWLLLPALPGAWISWAVAVELVDRVTFPPLSEFNGTWTLSEESIQHLAALGVPEQSLTQAALSFQDGGQLHGTLVLARTSQARTIATGHGRWELDDQLVRVSLPGASASLFVTGRRDEMRLNDWVGDPDEGRVLQWIRSPSPAHAE